MMFFFNIFYGFMTDKRRNFQNNFEFELYSGYNIEAGDFSTKSCYFETIFFNVKNFT